jgi:ATP-dependent helicase HrpB
MRLAHQLGEEPGQTIGFRIRFESKVSANTRIEVVTEGILTRMIQSDNALEEVGLIIFDEFHERSLQNDLALALSVQIQSILRDDLKLLIMSATLDGQKISETLNHAPVITSSGRQYPVDIRYETMGDEPLPTRMAKTIRKALKENDGDVLAFFPGAAEIIRTQQLLLDMNPGALIHTLYGDLPMKQQQEAIAPDTNGRRKIVLATSIAETSLTIEGIKMVVDSGLSRVPRFDPKSGLTRLETVKVTRDTADQRAGRAGRLSAGVAYRLWPEATHQHLLPNRSPEILEADLATLALELAQWGVKDVYSLRWITPPPAGPMKQAVELLQQLEAISGNSITERGKQMVKLPTHPRLAHMLLEAESRGNRSLSLACDVAAVLEERDPLPKEVGPDLSLRIEVFRKWRDKIRVNADENGLQRMAKVAAAWRAIFRLTPDNSIVSEEEVGELVALAYPERVARQVEKNSERYKLANGRMARLPANDHLTRYSWLAVAHMDAGNQEGKIFLASPLHEDALQHVAVDHEVVRWDSERKLIVASIERRVGNLVLNTRPLPSVKEERKIEVLCEAIRAQGLRMLDWSDTEKEWQCRVMSLRLWRPEELWPDVGDDQLLGTLETWLAPFLQKVSRQGDLDRLNKPEILNSLLPWNLVSALDQLAPTRLEVPSGSWIKVNYFEDGRPPVMEVRLQEVFGLLETPVVNNGRNKVLLHLLSPGYKPVQVTQDLHSFWQTTYHEVRKELRMRYPKHSWPEDPWTARAVRGVVRKVK